MSQRGIQERAFFRQVVHCAAAEATAHQSSGGTMTRFASSLMAGLVIMSLAGASPVLAQKHSQTRKGFWFNGGLGYGSLGCDGCGGREGAVSGNIVLGGTINSKFLLGVGMSGWSKSQ